MHIDKLLIVFIFLIKLCVCHTEKGVKKEIVSINIDEFNNILKDEGNYTLLIVYTHWSYNSNLLLENLDKLSKLLLYEENIKLCKINAAANTFIIDKLDVYSYPSLFMIRNKEIYRYNGVNNIRGLLLWIYQYLDFKIYEINNIERLDVFIDLNEYNNTILFFIFKDLGTANNNINNISRINDLINICLLTNKTLCYYIKENNVIDYFEKNIIQDKYHYNLKNINQDSYYAILFKNDEFDDYFFPLNKKELDMLSNNEYTNEEKIDHLYNWINEREQPLVIQFSEHFFSMLFSNDAVTLFIIYNNINNINKDDIIKCAKKYNHKIKFAISGTTQIFEKRLLNELLIEDNIKKPLMRITEFKNYIRFPYKYKPQSDDQEINEKGYPTIYLYKKGDKLNPVRYMEGRTVKNIITWICKETQSNIDISEFLNIDLDNEQLFENYEEL
ncbi:hypothetical protein PFUGPA_04266 [Plasmodium falciparum Palo Alto/Uganda]|uniref:Thioredoxin domain-containing protein n=2 Tax=Plasmodium falciparum TaxID=5833 RepID=W4IWN2_PLAFP|nr:hypothetical protein PFMALIP_05576 [Plasmodium falciparum MaliPS096_E11]ETW54400.1 hypothetical protein PFUGPA_04266 [Plasmodium falciparum Palo Alto/Uganda]